MGLMVTESEKSKHDMLRAMRKHIRENGITDFTDFQDWCDENNDMWSRALDLKCSWAIGNFIERRRNAIQQAAKLDYEKRRDNSGETIV